MIARGGPELLSLSLREFCGVMYYIASSEPNAPGITELSEALKPEPTAETWGTTPDAIAGQEAFHAMLGGSA